MKKNRQNGNKRQLKWPNDAAVTRYRGGRPKLYHVRVLVPFAADTLKRLDARLGADDTRVGFIRDAVDNALKPKRKRRHKIRASEPQLELTNE